MKVVSTLLTGGLVAGSLIAVTAPSPAALITHCIGEGGAVTVPGDLIVPQDQSCVLDGTIVQGDVEVQAGADLVVTSGTFEGNLVVRDDGFVDARQTSVAGNVTSRGSYGVHLIESTVDGNFTSPANVTRGAFLLADRSDFAGRVTDSSGSVLLVSSTVAKQVNTNGNVATDLEDSVVDGALTVTGTEEGSLVCASEVHGNTTYTDNANAVQIGGDQPWGTCVGAIYLGGNVTIDGTEGGVHLVDSIIRGDLTGEANDPAPVGHGNRVRGEVSGQFTDLGDASRLNRVAPGPDRIEEARGAAELRTAAALASAAEAGPARL